MGFLDENYLLENKPAEKLYSKVKDLPILDAHNHANLNEITNNIGWEDIWEVEAETDHYVWELMRKRGVPEKKITGEATNYEKWKALCEVFPEFATNPTYEWIHLDLKRRFGIDKLICSENADEIWEETKEKLSQENFKPQPLLNEMNVDILCTTDDPTMSLEYHKQMQENLEDTTVLPTWRPDKITNIDSATWLEDVQNLGKETETEIVDISDLLSALQKTHDYFDKMGCVASDHGVEQPYAYEVNKVTADRILNKALNKEKLKDKEICDYKAYMTHFYAELNSQSDWVMQLHIGAVRDYRDKLYKNLGPDSGGDISTQDIEFVDNLKDLLNKYDEKLEIVLYCLDHPIYLL